MITMPYSKIQRGTLLVSTPEIDSGLFFHSVILLCEHNRSGSFGLIINKPLEKDLPEDLINFKQLANPNINIRTGGPLQTNHMMILHNSLANPKQSIQICEDAFLGGNLQFLQASVTDHRGPQLNLCFGYTGWGPGQIEKEFYEGRWFLTKSHAQYIFHTPMEKIWRQLLLRMGGKFASLSMIPDDLSVN